MTQEEINNYNRRCAEFLGMEYEIHSNTWRYNDMITTELLFHSDWNWIHEVVEAIQKIRPLIISHNHCEIHMYEEGKNISINIATNSTITAVVQAINQFLIYYNNENSNNRQP